MTLRQIVSDFFGDYVGKFLEIGADGCNINYEEEPCSHLLVKGWYGLYCEPNPFTLGNLIKDCSQYKTDIICSAVSSTNKLTEFYTSESHPYLSSMESTWIDSCSQTMPEYFTLQERKEYKVFLNTVTPQEIFEKFGYDFDCISVDIELYPPQTHQIILDMDFNKLKTRMLIVEGSFKYTDEYMESFGFSKQINKHNTIYVR